MRSARCVTRLPGPNETASNIANSSRHWTNVHAQWGIDSPQLKTVFVNNVQQAANQAIVARLNRQRGSSPFWTLDVVKG